MSKIRPWTLRTNESSAPKNVPQNASGHKCDYLRYVSLLFCFTLKRCLILRGDQKKHFIGKHLWWTLFMLTILLKSDSNTGVFLWILQNFQEHLLCKKNLFFDSVNTFDVIRFYHILAVLTVWQNLIKKTFLSTHVT